jgi:hypothetical protein
MNIVYKDVSYSERRAKELGIHPDQLKKKKASKSEKSKSFQKKVEEEIVKKEK